MKHIAVAVDGPAGAGKSSVSKTAAMDLGYTYIDTGAMYRCVALFAIENGIDIKTEHEKLIKAASSIKISMEYADGAQKVSLNGRDVSERIRREDVSVGASDVAVIPEVREILVKMQRDMALDSNVIMDGRDICTHVLPNAQVKIFLTASPDERARRRYEELRSKGVECDFEEIKKDIIYRDENDSNRKASPLKKADDAFLLDTTGLSFDDVVKKVKELINNAV